MKETPKIRIACYRPAIDQILLLDDLALGEINEAQDFISVAAGKGINVFRTLTALGMQPELHTPYSTDLKSLFEQEFGVGIIDNNDCNLKVEQIRSTFSLIHDTNNMNTTHIKTDCQGADKKSIDNFSSNIFQNLFKEDTLILTGSLPDNLNKQALRENLIKAAKAGVRICIDFNGENLGLLRDIACQVIKPNKKEAEEHLQSSGFEIGNYANELIKIGLIAHWLVVTHGQNGAELLEKSSIKSNIFSVPPITTSTIADVGSGDSFLAILVFGMVNNWSAKYTMKRAIEFSSLCLKSPIPALPLQDDLDVFKKQYVVNQDL